MLNVNVDMGTRRQGHQGMLGFCNIVAPGSVPSVPSPTDWANYMFTGGGSSHGLIWSDISR